MKFDVELIGLPARIKVKFAPEPESVDVFTFQPYVEMNEVLFWFNEQLRSCLTVEEYIAFSIKRDLYTAGIGGLPEEYPHEIWPAEKYTSDLTPFQKANLEYQNAYNKAVREEKYKEVFDTIANLFNGGTNVSDTK